MAQRIGKSGTGFINQSVITANEINTIGGDELVLLLNFAPMPDIVSVKVGDPFCIHKLKTKITHSPWWLKPGTEKSNSWINRVQIIEQFA